PQSVLKSVGCGRFWSCKNAAFHLQNTLLATGYKHTPFSHRKTSDSGPFFDAEHPPCLRHQTSMFIKQPLRLVLLKKAMMKPA
ncbi:MAG: hypothetical protein VW945_06160, partial [Candidatus Poseidoniales archaeon]